MVIVAQTSDYTEYDTNLDYLLKTCGNKSSNMKGIPGLLITLAAQILGQPIQPYFREQFLNVKRGTLNLINFCVVNALKKKRLM